MKKKEMKKKKMKEMKRRRKKKAQSARKSARETVQGDRQRETQSDGTVDARAKTGSAGDQRDHRISGYTEYRNRVWSSEAVLVKVVEHQDIERYLIMYQPSYNSTKLLRSSR